MRNPIPKLIVLAAVCAASLALAVPALAAPAVTGVFNPATQVGQNSKIAAGPDGNMWFTLESATKDVGRITPAGAIAEYELPKTESPIGIAAGPEGRLWVVATGKATSFLPSDPKGTEETFELADIQAEPNIVLGPDGLMWVASNNKVAHFAPADPKGTIQAVTLAGELSPKDIDVAGPLIVIADGNMATKRLVTFTTAGAQKDVPITGGSQGVAGGGPSGQFAYSDPAATPEQSGLVTPPGPAAPFELLGDPFGVAFGSDHAYWIVQFAAGGLTRLTTGGARSFLPGLPKESARQVAAGPGNTLWVTLAKMGEQGIARVSGLEPPVTVTPPAPPPPASPVPSVVPNIKLGKTPKKVVKTTSATATVTFTFSTTTPGASFECVMAHRVKPKHKGGKARFLSPGFQACRSPKTYRLKPGSYRFQARSIVGSATTPKYPAYYFKVVRTKKR